VWLETHVSCNLRCPFCYNEFQAFPRARLKGTALTVAAATDILGAVRRYGTLNRVTLAGGEFFLHRQWRELIDVASSAGKEFVVVTNGTVIPRGAIQSLVESGTDLLQFSLHGATAVVHDDVVGKAGAFDALLKSANAARAAGLAIGFTYVRQDQPALDLVGVVEWAAILGASFVVVNEIRSAASPETAAELLLRKRRFGDYLREVDRQCLDLGVPIFVSTHIPEELLLSLNLQMVRSARTAGSFPRANIDCLGNLRPCLSSPVAWGNVLSGEPVAILTDYFLRQQRPLSSECHCAAEAHILAQADRVSA
jgi:pyruvate-formate lyase-activating enzyme